ncbi:N-acetylglucosamine-6-phosphate deacetylase [Nitratireductor sp. XY-223]|uniref:N-acetylglucosamine-6-phosphate deacetylase n=1 Tax=Nitratireductor sp. XY-223 TaxID=2561926 RepID=UPI0010AA797F|nr:N-acetylglucosamine-6-phosphate deacetylase [Nitratireductor sp. XY-223]
MTQQSAIYAPAIFDGSTWHAHAAVLYGADTVTGIVPASRLPDSLPVTRLETGMIVPGFVDLQVNGGGGVLMNDDPSVEAIETMCRAHSRFGTTALLPTLITDTPERTQQAIDAAAAALQRAVPGCLGLHLEGPHLSQARRGAHDAGLVRPAGEEDMERLLSAGKQIGNLLVTVAPEAVTAAQVALLSAAGIKVSLGHSDAGRGTASEMVSAGATLFTHLFNAMSPLGHREPGMVGAALSEPSVYAGLIADGIHVDPASMGIAVRGKQGPGKIFLVTDAMSTIGSDLTEFTLNGRTVYRSNGRLTLKDGTLAGADIDMIASVRVLVGQVGLDLSEALRMASLYPARAMGIDASHGRIGEDTRADFVHLSDALAVERVWIGGSQVFGAD